MSMDDSIETIMKGVRHDIYNAGQRGMHEAFLNPTPTTYQDYTVPILREANNGSSSGSGIMPFREHLSKPDTLSNSRLNEAFVNGSIDQQSLWPQQHCNSPQMSNQAQAPKPISVLGNMPLPQSWVANPSGRMMVGDYVNMSKKIPKFGAVQSSPPLGFANFAGQYGHFGLPLTEHASHPCPPGVFGRVGTLIIRCPTVLQIKQVNLFSVMLYLELSIEPSTFDCY